MSDVLDLDEYRALRATPPSMPPPRRPDMTMELWLEAGEVMWTCTNWGSDPALQTHGARVAAMIDATWQYAAGHPGAEWDHMPALWWTLGNDGGGPVLFGRWLYEGADFTHALWLARQWWRLTLKLARIAWWMCRGGRKE